MNDCMTIDLILCLIMSLSFILVCSLMTVVAVKILRNHIEIACDSCVSYWYRNKMEWSTKSVIKDYSKIFTTNWVTVWCSWLLEHSIWLKEHLKTNLPKSATLDDMESFFLKFYKQRKEKTQTLKRVKVHLL